jgi:LAO/AO transport system kinase
MDLARKILEGDVRSVARLMSLIENGEAEAIRALKDLYAHTGKAHIVGITGPPGSGKSTLTDRLIEAYRTRGRTVGVVAVDPTSPFTGGAILADRLRMQRHYLDDGVFIRSMATRGHLGGLARATNDVVDVLDATGKDVVVIETVGVGQAEVEIVKAAHTSVVTTVPGLGDGVQTIKAGIMEIGDIFVVNKADREGADRTVRDLEMALMMNPVRGPWTPPICRTVATKGEGVEDLRAAIESHRQCILGADGLRGKARERTQHTFMELLRERLSTRALERAGGNGTLARLLDRIVRRETDPYTAVEEVLSKLGL